MGLFGFGKKKYLKFGYGASLYKFSFDKRYNMTEYDAMWIGICCQADKMGVNLDWTTMNTIAQWIERCKSRAGWIDACGNAAINLIDDFSVESDGRRESQLIKDEIQRAKNEVDHGNPEWWTNEVSRDRIEDLLSEYSCRAHMFL